MRRSLLLFAVLALCACEQPPNKEIVAAEKQLEEARKAGADQYAPARLQEADAAIRDAHRKVDEKDYRGALSAASDAADKARGASNAAAAAKALARGAAETAQAEARVLLEEAAQIRQEAVKSRVPEAAFEKLEPHARKVNEDLEAVSAILQRGDMLEAQRAAAAVKTEAATLPAQYRTAVETWQAAHPKGRARPPAKAPVRKR